MARVWKTLATLWLTLAGTALHESWARLRHWYCFERWLYSYRFHHLDLVAAHFRQVEPKLDFVWDWPLGLDLGLD
jgi:hypothetical protein